MNTPCEQQLKEVLVFTERYMEDERKRLNQKYTKKWAVNPKQYPDTTGYLFAERIQETLWIWLGKESDY